MFSLEGPFVSLDALTISDRFPVEQVQTPGGQASILTVETWDSFNLSVMRPERTEWMWRTQIITKMAETFILKRLVNGPFQQLSLLCLFGCLPNEMSEGSLSFHLFYWRSTAEGSNSNILFW